MPHTYTHTYVYVQICQYLCIFHENECVSEWVYVCLYVCMNKLVRPSCALWTGVCCWRIPACLTTTRHPSNGILSAIIFCLRLALLCLTVFVHMPSLSLSISLTRLRALKSQSKCGSVLCLWKVRVSKLCSIFFTFLIFYFSLNTRMFVCLCVYNLHITTPSLFVVPMSYY